jgi:osmotically-inducible protein OsmY
MKRIASVSTVKQTLIVLFAFPTFAASRQPQTTDLTPAFRTAGVTLADLRVTEVGGIVVIRGQASDADTAAQLTSVAQSLGYARVANLVKVVATPDDADIERRAERELARHRSLDGCRIAVDSDGGVLLVSGSVQYELQKDAALEILRNVNGVRSVKMALQRF